MDWSKAKNILIVVFLLLNIFLAVILGKYYFSKDVSNGAMENTLVLLNLRGVDVRCEIPYSISESGALSFTSDYLDQKSIIKILLKNKENLSPVENKNAYVVESRELEFIDDNTFLYKDMSPMKGIDILNTSDVLKYVKELVYEIIPVSRFQVDSITQNKDQSFSYVLNERYKNYIVFDNYIMLNVTKDGILSFKCKYRKINDIVSIRKILPCYQMLIKNFNQKNQSVVITNIDMGFKENIIEDGTKGLNDISVWRIKTQAGEEFFYKAYTGEKIQ